MTVFPVVMGRNDAITQKCLPQPRKKEPRRRSRACALVSFCDNLSMTTLGKSIVVRGELRASEDLTVEGRIDGPISCEHGSVVVSASAHVNGKIIARDIIVFGRTAGQLIAADVVDIRPEATVSGQVISKRFILDAKAQFNGRVAPQQLEAALGVARYVERGREAASRAET
jgi:cytoskeletal protein CcmA (bactofilin family)